MRGWPIFFLIMNTSLKKSTMGYKGKRGVIFGNVLTKCWPKIRLDCILTYAVIFGLWRSFPEYNRYPCPDRGGTSIPPSGIFVGRGGGGSFVHSDSFTIIARIFGVRVSGTVPFHCQTHRLDRFTVVYQLLNRYRIYSRGIEVGLHLPPCLMS